MADAPTTAEFRMHGAWAAIDGGFTHIEEQVKGIERSVVENTGLAFDLARNVIEGSCKTILAERSVTFDRRDDLPKLFKLVVKNLPLLPVEARADTEARKSLEKTLGGLQSAILGICELRNTHGFASHGVGGPRPEMESVQALLAATAADAIVGFLHRVHRQERTVEVVPRLEYDDNHALNAYIDEANDTVRIFDLEYRPSEVLFGVDQEAYRDILSRFDRSEADAPSGDPACAAEKHKQAIELGDLAKKLYERFVQEGSGDLDFSAIIRAIRQR